MLSTPFVPVPPERYGGTELVIAELVDGLIERGHEVVLFAAPGSTGGFRRRCEVRTPLARLAWPPSAEVEAAHCLRAAQAIARERFDVVHAHSPSAVDLAAEFGAPLVCTLHHARVPACSAHYARHPEVTYAAISARQLELEAPLPHARVVHHGLDPERYRFGAVPGEQLAFLGRLSECKGPDVALDVAWMLKVPIHVAGKPHPPDEAFFAKELRWRLARPHVTWLGEADHAQKCALLSRARALLFPIRWEEPFGLVAVEAMLCGCPVVAYPRGAAAEIVEDGVTGILVESPREMAAAVRFLSRPNGLDRRACRARAAERFGAPAMVDGYVRLYLEAAGLVGLDRRPGTDVHG